jgi:DNA-directed RNA polymerase subunit RPC12/RpoP
MPDQTSAQVVAATPNLNGDPSAANASTGDVFDSAHAEVPLICKDCGKDFAVPYRHFQVGVVFHCPHCHGSFVPRLPIYHAVRDAFQRQAADFEKFKLSLLELARSMHPAGKMVRRKGLAAMFT